jgi:MFS family permease
VIVAVAWAETLLFPLFVVAPNIFLLGAILAGLFMLNPIYNVTQFSYRLALIPDHLQGRVNSSFRLLAYGFQPIGAALSGILLDHIGVVPTVLVFATWFVVLAVLTTLNSYVRNAPRIEEAQAG